MKKLKTILYFPGMMIAGMTVGNCVDHLVRQGFTDRIYMYGIVMSILFVIYAYTND